MRSPVTGDYDNFGYNFAPTPESTRYVITFDQLQQEGWGKKANQDRLLKQVISATVGQTIDVYYLPDNPERNRARF